MSMEMKNWALVLPLCPPPKGESCPNKFSVKFIFLIALLGLGCSWQKIFDFLYSPFGGGVGGRILSRLIFKLKEHVIGNEVSPRSLRTSKSQSIDNNKALQPIVIKLNSPTP